MSQGSMTPASTELVVAILTALIAAFPQIATWISKGIEDDDSDLADRVRAILPFQGASEAARRKLEGGL